MIFSKRQNPLKLFICGRCGKRHKPKSCPAYGQQCAIFQKFHHFVKMGRNKPSVAKSFPLDAKKKVFFITDQIHQRIQIHHQKMNHLTHRSTQGP